MSFEPDDIIAAMTREELRMYRALGGQLSGVQQQRLLGRSMRALDWYQPPASPGVVLPPRDVQDLDRRVRDACRALCPAAAGDPAPPPPVQRKPDGRGKWIRLPGCGQRRKGVVTQRRRLAC